MKTLSPLLFVLLAACSKGDNTGNASGEMTSLKAQADAITIVRDNWGIPHVRGKTDADAVFGLVYAQAEDDFNRIETNILMSQGRPAEAEGRKELWRDLRMQLFIDPEDM